MVWALERERSLVSSVASHSQYDRRQGQFFFAAARLNTHWENSFSDMGGLVAMP
jgi:hypothetical protein